MEVVRIAPGEPCAWARAAVAVGNLDGVHRGHQALASRAVEDARRSGAVSVALTFDPHPARVLSPERAPSALMTIAQKAEALAALGVDRLAVLPFTHALSQREPEDFARAVLAEAVRASVVVVGADFRFGRGRAGDVAGLRAVGTGCGFRVDEVPPVLHEGAPVSSSRIREALARGAVAAAAGLLGRPYFVDGTVVRGDGRGRTIGVPTANLELLNETLPRGGVYAARCEVSRDGRRLPAVVNLGRRPTFGGTTPTVEAHLLDFDRDLYGCPVRLTFVERLRDERAFAGKDALVAQIHDDIAAARRLLVPSP